MDTHTFRRRSISDVAAFHTTVRDAADTFVDVITDDIAFLDSGQVSLNTGVAPGAPVGPMPHLDLTERAVTQFATRSDVPTKYARRIFEHHRLLWRDTMSTLYPSAPSLVRTNTMPSGPRQVRAVLSDKYAFSDNADVFTTLMRVLVEEGLSANDVTFRGDFDPDNGSMIIDVAVPHIAVAAHELVSDYRSPFNGKSGRDLPMVFAGLTIRNNECGHGALQIGPKAIIEVCSNGMTRPIDAFRQVHLGGRLEQGTVTWSEDTRSKRLAFIASAAGDAVRKFLSPEYVQSLIDEALVAKGIQVQDVSVSMAKLAKFAELTAEESTAALNAFMDGGDRSLLGLAQAVTAMSQQVLSGDRQAELDDQFFAIVNNPQLAAA